MRSVPIKYRGAAGGDKDELYLQAGMDAVADQFR